MIERCVIAGSIEYATQMECPAVPAKYFADDWTEVSKQEFVRIKHSHAPAPFSAQRCVADSWIATVAYADRVWPWFVFAERPLRRRACPRVEQQIRAGEPSPTDPGPDSHFVRFVPGQTHEEIDHLDRIKVEIQVCGSINSHPLHPMVLRGLF